MAKTMLLGAATVVWLESTFHAPLLSSAPGDPETSMVKVSNSTGRRQFFHLWKTCYLLSPTPMFGLLSTPCG
jgi:hypothetical protein